MTAALWAVVGLSGGALAAAATAVVLAIRLAGVRDEAAKLELRLGAEQIESQRLEEQVQYLARQLTELERSHRQQLVIRDENIEQLYDDLASCSTPAAVRDRLNRTFVGSNQ